MKRATALFTSFCITSILLSSPLTVSAQNLLSFGIGSYDLSRPNNAPTLQIEYLGLKTKFLSKSLKLSPYAGLQITRDGTLWIGGGFARDFKLSNNIYLTPSLGIGYYNQGNSHLDLGHPIEFKSSLTASYEFQNKHRLGITFTHLSNAGLGNTNPGAEILGVNYTIPLE